MELIHNYFDGLQREARTERKQYDVERTRAMILAYIDYYQNDGYRTVAIEQPFELPMIDWRTGEPIPGVTYCGKIDVLLEKNGQIYICDHKTASKVDNNYWLELKSNNQVTTYMMACLQMGIQVAGVLWDVVLKPTDSVAKLSGQGVPKKVLQGLQQGMYRDLPYPDTDWEGRDTETPKMHGVSTLVRMSSTPSEYFHRQDLLRTGPSIVEWMKDVEEITRRMADVKAGRRSLRNLANCKAFNSLCEYHQLCAGSDRDDYQQRVSTNTDGFSSDAVSVSSLNQFASCERSWFHRKVEKIEQRHPDYSSPLAVGTMYHQALEIWLKTKMSDMKVTFEGNLLGARNE